MMCDNLEIRHQVTFVSLVSLPPSLLVSNVISYLIQTFVFRPIAFLLYGLLVCVLLYELFVSRFITSIFHLITE